MAAKSLSALDGGTALTSIQLTGAITRNWGSIETGSVALEATLGPAGGESRVEFDLPSGNRIELRGEDESGTPWGAWIDAQGSAHAMALHNCWTPAVWFLPRLSVLRSARPGDKLSENSQAPADSGPPLQGVDLRRVRVVSGQSAGVQAEIETLSVTDLVLDASSGLPVVLRYTLHPDKNLLRDIPVEVRFSSFEPVGGVEIPFHIQRYIQHALVDDIEITNAVINPPLSASDFAEPEMPAGQPANSASAPSAAQAGR